jgi:hypothetical protein
MRHARTTGDGGRVDDMPPRDLQPHSVWYEADGAAPADECVGKYRPGMFMPRWASRVTLEVADVRVVRLQSISYEDAIAEGMFDPGSIKEPSPVTGESGEQAGRRLRSPQRNYAVLWDELNAAAGYGWNANPWVWVVEFRRIDQ